MTRVIYVFLCLSMIVACHASPNVNQKPKLVLVIAVDQMRYDYLTRFDDLYAGGIRTLLRDGAVFSNARYRHSTTETGPGHSVMLTGRHGSHSGIVANYWFDRVQKKYVNVVDDPICTVIGGKGRGASPANLIGFTLGDLMKKINPATRVVGVSLKDRSAVLMAGKHADAAYWYDPDTGAFVSSTYYMKALPDWLIKWNASRPGDRFFGKIWNRLNPNVKVYEKYAGPDDVSGEWDRKDTVFPHSIRGAKGSKEYFNDLSRFPAADEMTLEVALAAMKAHQLGMDEVPDILAIGFSGTDYIGHTYGPDSQELLDQILRLDLILQKLFEEVNRTAGMGHTLVVLTSDHGVMPLVENLQSKGIAARRVSPDVLTDSINKALAKEYPGVVGLVASLDAPNVYINEDIVNQHGLRLAAVEDSIQRALQATGTVDNVYTRSTLETRASQGDPYYTLVRNNFYSPRSPNVIAVLKEFLYMDYYSGGTGHGTVHDYDRHVPIIFRGQEIRAGTYVKDCGPEDIAPTLGRILGVDMLKEEDARILEEML